MKRVVRIGLGLSLLLAAAIPGASLANVAAFAQSDDANPAAVEQSRRAIATLDMQRLLSDRDYAAAILGHLDVLDETSDDPGFASAIDNIRLPALMMLERREEIGAVVDRVLVAGGREVAFYAPAWWSTMSIPDLARATEVVVTASRRVPGVEWPQLRELLGIQSPWFLLGELEKADDDANRVRLAEALYRIGWPGDGDLEAPDHLRTILIDGRLAQRDRAGAMTIAAGITTPASVLKLVLLKRYDPVVGADSDRAALLASAIAGYDRATATAISGATPSLARVLDRARYFRSLGREEEAYALLAPYTRDVPATAANGEFGMWLVNEASYALLSLDRDDEAVTLMARLVELPVEGNPGLVGPFINHIEILRSAGRAAEALAHAQRLERDYAGFANDYGKMWISAGIVCALAALGRQAETAPLMERMAASDANPAATTRAYLCLNDMAAAEALLIRRLEDERHQEAAVLALQDYQVENDPDPLVERLLTLRERPAVRAALERVGRQMRLPLARTYYGGV